MLYSFKLYADPDNIAFLQELYQNLEKARPNLFRLASDTDEKDNEGISMWFRCGFLDKCPASGSQNVCS